MALMFAVTFGPIGTFLTGLTERLIAFLGEWAVNGLAAIHAARMGHFADFGRRNRGRRRRNRISAADSSDFPVHVRAGG